MIPPDVRGGASRSAAQVEESTEELYEDAPCGYLSTAPDGTIQRANRTFLALTGYALADLVGQLRFYDLLPPGAKIYYETHYAPLLQMQGTVREIALELVRADGSRLPILVNAVLKHDESGRPLLVRITVFDASDRRRYEQELLHARGEAEARAAAALALEHVTEGVVLVDQDGAIRLLNHAAERIFGVDAPAVVGRPLSALTSDWATLESRIPVIHRDGNSAPSVVMPFTVHARTRWIAVSGEPAPPEGVVYTLRDVTEERRLEEMRDDIIAIVSHELRTPLAGVLGAAQTLRALGERLGEEQRHQLLDVIGEQAGRLNRIVDQILLAQNLDAGGLVVARLRFDVGEVVAKVVDSTRSWRSTRAIALDIGSSVDAEGDPALFEQVISNLIDNAFKYSPEETEVRIKVGLVRASVRVTVTDEGDGISAEDEDRIFEKFFRLDPAHAHGTGGTGLGLYIARELVRRMHGRLGIVHGAPSTTFFVDLPLHRPGT